MVGTIVIVFVAVFYCYLVLLSILVCRRITVSTLISGQHREKMLEFRSLRINMIVMNVVDCVVQYVSSMQQLGHSTQPCPAQPGDGPVAQRSSAQISRGSAEREMRCVEMFGGGA